MGQFVVENAHLSTDRKKYGDNYDHVFNRDKCQCAECEAKRIIDYEVECLKSSNPETPDSSEQSP